MTWCKNQQKITLKNVTLAKTPCFYLEEIQKNCEFFEISRIKERKRISHIVCITHKLDFFASGGTDSLTT